MGSETHHCIQGEHLHATASGLGWDHSTVEPQTHNDEPDRGFVNLHSCRITGKNVSDQQLLRGGSSQPVELALAEGKPLFLPPVPAYRVAIRSV